MPFDEDTPLDVRWLNARDWQLLADLVYRGKTDTFTVPAGYTTDFATVPWWIRWLIAQIGKWTRAAVVHDLLCSALGEWHELLKVWLDRMDGDVELLTTLIVHSRGLRREDGTLVPVPQANAVDTDRIFRRIMREEGVDPVRRWLAWTGVRWAALFNPARREGWLREAPAVLGVSAVVVAALVALVVLLA